MRIFNEIVHSLLADLQAQSASKIALEVFLAFGAASLSITLGLLGIIGPLAAFGLAALGLVCSLGYFVFDVNSTRQEPKQNAGKIYSAHRFLEEARKRPGWDAPRNPADHLQSDAIARLAYRAAFHNIYSRSLKSVHTEHGQALLIDSREAIQTLSAFLEQYPADRVGQMSMSAKVGLREKLIGTAQEYGLRGNIKQAITDLEGIVEVYRNRPGLSFEEQQGLLCEYTALLETANTNLDRANILLSTLPTAEQSTSSVTLSR